MGFFVLFFFLVSLLVGSLLPPKWSLLLLSFDILSGLLFIPFRNPGPALQTDRRGREKNGDLHSGFSVAAFPLGSPLQSNHSAEA